MKRFSLIAAAALVIGLSLTTSFASAAQVATAPDGTVTLVSETRYMRIAPDGTRTPFVSFAPGTEGGIRPSVALAPDGTATVVWVGSDEQGTAIFARRIDPAGALEGGIATLGHSEGTNVFPEVVVAPDGTATAVWTATIGGTTVVQSSRIAPDGTAQETPTDLALDAAYRPDVAVAPNGTATVVWQQLGNTRSVAAARQIHPDGTLGSVLELSSGIGSSQPPAVAMTPDGAAIVVWKDIYHQAVGVPPKNVLEERRIAPDGTLDPTVNVISEEGNPGSPVLAAGPDGTVTILWSQKPNLLLERRIEPDGTPEATTYDVSSPVAGGGNPLLAIADDGSATVVWTTGWQIFTRRLAPDGVPVGQPLTVLESNGALGLIGMGFEPDGDALPIWSRRLGYYEIEYVTQARRLPATGEKGAVFDLTEPGTEPATWASPTAIDFGAIPVNATATQTVTFTNRSVDATPVTGVFLRGPDAKDFEIVEDGCTGTSIPFASTCSVTVAFDPKGKGSAQAELALEASAPREPRAVPLSGTAVPPSNGSSAAVLNSTLGAVNSSFGPVPVEDRGDSAGLSPEAPRVGNATVTATCGRARKARTRTLSKQIDPGKARLEGRTSCRRGKR